MGQFNEISYAHEILYANVTPGDLISVEIDGNTFEYQQIGIYDERQLRDFAQQISASGYKAEPIISSPVRGYEDAAPTAIGIRLIGDNLSVKVKSPLWLKVYEVVA